MDRVPDDCPLPAASPSCLASSPLSYSSLPSLQAASGSSPLNTYLWHCLSGLKCRPPTLAWSKTFLFKAQFKSLFLQEAFSG